MEKMRNISVVIMAGGFGTRMKKISSSVPKPLIEYMGKPMIENVLNVFISQGFIDFHIILHYKSKIIKSYIEALELPINIKFYIEEEPLGTAGGLRLLKNNIQETFILCNCDNLGDFDYKKLIEEHKKNESLVTIPVIKREHVIPYGVITEKGGVFVSIDENPIKSICISTGIHILSEKFINYINNREKIDMPQLLNRVEKEDRIGCIYVEESQWTDMSIIGE